MSSLRRKFDNVYFVFHDSYKSKTEANQEASTLRASGYLVRITRPASRMLPYYELWKRKGRKS